MNQEMSGVHVFRPYQILLWAAVPIYFVHEENIMPKAILILPRVAWMLNSQLSIPHNLGLLTLTYGEDAPEISLDTSKRSYRTSFDSVDVSTGTLNFTPISFL